MTDLTKLVRRTDGTVVRGIAAVNVLLVPNAFTHGWRCFAGTGTNNDLCYAPDGVRCLCRTSSIGHDPGDEDRRAP